MTPEQSAAFIAAQAVSAFARVMGMQAENMQRQSEGNAMAYVEMDFENVVHEHVLEFDEVIKFFYDGLEEELGDFDRMDEQTKKAVRDG